jgi:hypothetical protein
MADRAAEGHYHDFLSPLDFPAMQLAADLALIDTPATWALRKRVMDGEFDASKEESDEWAESADGRDTLERAAAAVGGKPVLGPCCICEGNAGVHNIVMLPRRCAVPGHGWGCAVCGLPPDGASAVLCDHCLERYQADESALLFACRGYPASDGRMSVAELSDIVFEHDAAKHAADEQ